MKLNKNVPEEALASIGEIEDPAKLADTIAGHLGVKLSERQTLLEEPNVAKRMEGILGLIQGEISVLQVEKKIKSRVKTQMEKTQREYYLNEQMKAIQRELGEGDDGKDDSTEYERQIAETKLSKEAREKAVAELKKLKNMSPMSAEATVVRNYLDWMLSIPWGKKTRVKKDLVKAQDGAGRRSLRAGEGQGADRRVSGGTTAFGEAEGADFVSGGAAGCGQDLAGQVGGAGDGA